MLHRLRQMGLSVRLYEAGGGVGGTWFWNRYPGAGSDIESLEYSYAFSEELQQEWKWTKRYASQPEIEDYLNHVADRFDLRRDIVLSTRIDTMAWDEDSGRWLVLTSNGEKLAARYCMMATGLLSSPMPPPIAGYDSFGGLVLQTSSWPLERPEFEGKRVGIIGTGSSAVQSIPIIAKEALHLTVFQRTPNFSTPLHNGPLDPTYEQRVKADYAGWRAKQMDSFGGYVSINFQALEANPNAAMDVTPEEREAEYNFRWASGGLCFYTSFKDLLFSREGNDGLADYVRKQIRPRIKDPAIAKLLLPTDYPILTKRLCADTGYYETFNRSNVSLVDVRANPIDEIVTEGIVVAGKLHELDVMIFATGFDAITGTLVKMDIRGVGGKTIAEAWNEGPRTNAGLMTHSFPNMFFLNGPGSCTAFFNPVLNVEYQGNWIADLLRTMHDRGETRVESDATADDAWAEHMREVAAPTLFWESNNWFIGANIPGKPRVMMLYLGGFSAYRQHTASIAAENYRGFTIGTSTHAGARETV